MSDTAITTCEFLGATLWGVRGSTRNNSKVAMKPLVEGMGLDWKSQHRKLSDHPVLAPTMVMMPMVGDDGAVREVVTLPLAKLPFWLATIQTGRIPDAKVRERVVEFQRRVCDVLEEAFFGNHGHQPNGSPQPTEAKPFEEWTLEEIRVSLSVANAYRHTFNNAAAGWMLLRQGFPKPPQRLLPAWWQPDLDVEAKPATGAVTITVPYANGGTH